MAIDSKRKSQHMFFRSEHTTFLLELCPDWCTMLLTVGFSTLVPADVVQQMIREHPYQPQRKCKLEFDGRLARGCACLTLKCRSIRYGSRITNL